MEFKSSQSGRRTACRFAVIAATLFISFSLCNAQSTPIVFHLWPEGAPTDNGLTGPERDYKTHVSNVTDPTLTVFLPEKPNGMAVLACPGGGYVDVWYGTEGINLAEWYNSQGIVYGVLKYRLPNGHTEIPLDDVHKAMDIMKEHQDEWQFQRLGIQGCSAGGHLAASASTLYDTDAHRPDFQILFYPVITMDRSYTHMGSLNNLLGRTPTVEQLNSYSLEKRVTPQTPQAFIMASSDDGLVPVRNSIEYYNALVANKVSVSMHLFPVGGHGWCGNENFPYRTAWMNELKLWLELINH